MAARDIQLVFAAACFRAGVAATAPDVKMPRVENVWRDELVVFLGLGGQQVGGIGIALEA